MRRTVPLLLLLFALVVSAAAGSAPAAPPQSRLVAVVLELEAPSLAQAAAGGRSLLAATERTRLDLRSRSSVLRLRSLARQQARLVRRLRLAVPGAQVRWRYRIVVNGLAIVVRSDRVGRLASLPGVHAVYGAATYRPQLDRSPAVIGAPTLYGPGFEGAGTGMKIGIIDDGVDQSHPFFEPGGLAMPAGFPKGQRAYTTAKVIVARSFPPASPPWRDAGKPFDPVFSEHGTHVAGIAAGTVTRRANRQYAGVAPRAYIGNYKVLTIPTASNVGLDGNSPEIVAGIEAAVRDGMDVINLSLGEPEIEPSRDIVVRAIDGAAAAGVVPAVAAGNDFTDVGRGSVSSPGSAEGAITAAAVTKGGAIAEFSAAGPTPLSLRLKPDVSAPGADIVSSVPRKDGLWAAFSGTSMASPHVAGAAALLRQRHPEWTVAQVKSALVLTGGPVSQGAAEVPTTRQGGGLINLPRADQPLVFAAPTNVSFGFIRPGRRATESLELTDAGGGAGLWAVSLEQQSRSGVTLTVPGVVAVPGRLELTAAATAGASEREVSAYVVLTRDAERRRIPVWLRIIAPSIARRPDGHLRKTGSYSGNTAGRPARVRSYRYPDRPAGLRLRDILPGPEQIFRVTLRRPVANFGVAITSQARGVRIEPRVLLAGNENRQTGYAALPINLNPYLATFQQRLQVVGAVLPAAGSYDVVFDTPSRVSAGRFAFRFWIDDTAPPTVRLLTRTAARGGTLRLAVADRESGIDATSFDATIDDTARTVRFDSETGQAEVPVGALAPGRHRLSLQASDLQETKNNENVPQILPNTRRLRTTFTVR